MTHIYYKMAIKASAVGNWRQLQLWNQPGAMAQQLRPQTAQRTQVSGATQPPPVPTPGVSKAPGLCGHLHLCAHIPIKVSITENIKDRSLKTILQLAGFQSGHSLLCSSVMTAHHCAMRVELLLRCTLLGNKSFCPNSFLTLHKKSTRIKIVS